MQAQVQLSLMPLINNTDKVNKVVNSTKNDICELLNIFDYYCLNDEQKNGLRKAIKRYVGEGRKDIKEILIYNLKILGIKQEFHSHLISLIQMIVDEIYKNKIDDEPILNKLLGIDKIDEVKVDNWRDK